MFIGRKGILLLERGEFGVDIFIIYPSLTVPAYTSPLCSTFPIPNNQADVLIRVFNSSIANPVFATVPFVQHDGTTSLHEWGVTAHIARFVRPRAQSYLLTFAVIIRIRLVNTSTNTSPSTNNTATGTSSTSDASPHPLPRVTVIHSPPDAQSPPAPDIVQDFKATAIRLLERFAQDTSQSAQPDKAAALADAIVSAVGAEYADKLALLSTESPSLRLQHVTHLLTKQLSIAEVSTKIAMAVDKSLSKRQKALFLRQQLEVRRVASTEASRLRWIPPQNAEHGVVRNCLDWLTALPWTPPPPGSDTLTRTDFLPNAKSQLDADHFSLDKVKLRLTEYLAVVRLRALTVQEAEMEQVKAQEVVLKDGIEDQKDTRATESPSAAFVTRLRSLAIAGHMLPVTQYTREAGVRTLKRVIGGVVRFKAVEWAAHIDVRGPSPSSAPSPVSSLPSSPTVADTDAAGGLDKSARFSDAGYDPVVEADELVSRHGRED
ncbi:hypothetical protein F5888DRAFT_1803386 [Russula emetica]|nr:hypothetical protein F5888DRAFT_1803386 [Russula emetica]